MSRKRLLSFLPFLFSVGLVASPELVTVGDVGNAGRDLPFGDIARPYPRGAVDHPYRIGRDEVSNADYAAFLNACAAGFDPHGLFDPRMAIDRTGTVGTWSYAPKGGASDEGVRFVSRVNAARYCNYLTSGTPDQGAYVVAKRPREDGSTHAVIVGYRDLTLPDAARVYHLPDMHEFYKAGWYDRAGGWRDIAPETRGEPSAYGLTGCATGGREWMDNKYHAGAPFALGADDSLSDADSLNAVRIFMQREYEADARTGFRVAATAPLQIGDRLNHTNNFFFDAGTPAVLRVRLDGTAREVALTMELRDFTNQAVWSKTLRPQLVPGVTELPVELPAADGYYELSVTPGDPLFEGRAVVIPLAVMREPMPGLGATGRFGFTTHIVRRERRFSFETFDFDLLRKLGVSQVRVDVGFDDIDGSQTVLRRIRAAGLNPLAIITHSGIRKPADIARNQADHPELVAKWGARGIPAEYAWYAEQVYNLVSANRDIVHDWEFGNEPTYWDCLPEDYAQSLKAGYKAAKLADPSCGVMSGDLNAIHAPVLQSGGAAFADSVATHIYGFYVPSFWGIAGKMRELNGWLRAAGAGHRPVWITEIGGCTYNAMHMIPVRTLDEVRRYQAVHQPKVMAGGLAFGATKVLPYNFRDVPVDSLEEEFGMLDRHGLPKPAIAAYRATARLLGDARFVGFVAGHSFDEGRVAGLAFKDADDRDVLVFWRNDPYGYGRFDIPFDDIIKPPQNVFVPASGQDGVECFNLSGGRSTLPVENGRVAIPVSEYPVFVRGRLTPVLANVATARDIPPLSIPPARVKILPDYKSRACDLMAGVVLELTERTTATVRIRIYNTRAEPIAGTVRLVPRSNWREWPWRVSPEKASVEIPADGMATVAFTLPVPAASKPDALYYMDAIFAPDAPDGAEFRDTVAFRVTAPKLRLADWITYAQGYRLSPEADQARVRITWEKDRASYVSFFLRRPVAFAADAAGLDREVTLPIRPESGAGVRAVSLLFQDRNNETFQIKQSGRLPDGDWTTLRFTPREILGPNVIIHRGGDRTVDFPVRLLGFTIDLDARDGGSVLLRPYAVGSRSGIDEAAPPADGGGGAVGMDL